MSHALDCEFFGLQPSGHHFSNLLLHALNAVLVFLIAFYGTRREGPSLVLALLFALHPVNVESVAWVAERKNVLSTFFFLLTLGAYGWYARKPHWTRYLAVAILFSCGLLSKPMVVTLPLVLLLLDYWPLERIGQKTSFQKLLIEKLPLIALSAVSSVITVRVQQAGGALRSAAQFPFAVRLENALLAYALYIWKAFWPLHLAPLYPHRGASVSPWQIAAATLLLAAITGLSLKLRTQKYLLLGWLWFLGTTVPVIGVVQVGDQAMADRYAYIPLIGLFLMFTWAIADFRQSRRISRTVSATIAVGVLAAFAVATNHQIGYWSSSVDLWSHTLAVTTNNSLAHRNLGWALLALNQPAEALPQFRAAAEITPSDATNHINLGLCLGENHLLAEAIEQYKRAISLTSDAGMLASIYTNLGSVYAETGDYPEAHESYERALQLNSSLFNAYLNRGHLFEREGKLEDAVADYQRSIKIRPTANGYLELARALKRLNRVAEAQASYQQALKLASDPDAIQK